MMPKPHRFARLLRPAHRGFRSRESNARATINLPHYPGTTSACLHDAHRLQNPCSAPLTFDFSIPEARLLLTRFPLFAQAPEFGDSPHPRLTPPRILTNWGLTNGNNGVMIDCMHDANHSRLRRTHGPFQLSSVAVVSARGRLVGTFGASGYWICRAETLARALG
jgi:hypothetical protein